MSRRVTVPGYSVPSARTLRLPAASMLLVGDIVALIAAFVLSTVVTEFIQTRFLDRAPAEFYSPYLADRLAIVGFLSCLVMTWFTHNKHYTARRGYWTEIKHILLGIAAIALIDGWLHFSLKMQASRLWQFQLWVYAASFIICSRSLVRLGLTRLGLWKRRTLLISPSDDFDELRAFATGETYLGYEVHAAIATDLGEDGVLARIEDHLVRDPDLAYALIACEGMSLGLLGRIIDIFDREKISYGLIPPLRGVPLLGFEVDHFVGHDFMVLQSHPPLFDRQHTRTAKRCVDLMGASLLVLLLSPLLLAIAALVRVDGGPVLYRSRRLGFAGSIFFALKFRTMRPDSQQILAELLARDPALRAEWQANYKLKDDPRTTRLGRLLRRTSLDELPQLINVLRGEMSLVGPRPLLLDEVPRHQSGLHLYTKVLPGITGMWQVSGRDDLEYDRRMQLNNWYVHNWSFWHDLVILLKTLVVVARGRGAS